MMLVDKRPVPQLPQQRRHSHGHGRAHASPLITPVAAAAAAAAAAPAVTATRKRKIIVDEAAEKRARHAWTELEYEMVLEEATLLREELELLVAVALDLCKDLNADESTVRRFVSALAAIGELMASSQDLTAQQIREMCQQMLAMMQYLCRFHYDHFALIDMQDQLRECRNRFMLFICQNADMIGLRG